MLKRSNKGLGGTSRVKSAGASRRGSMGLSRAKPKPGSTRNTGKKTVPAIGRMKGVRR